jgi:hypothetical protein
MLKLLHLMRICKHLNQKRSNRCQPSTTLPRRQRRPSCRPHRRNGPVDRREYRRRGDLGDTLADFIIIELAETYDPKASREEQLEEAQRSMNAAFMQLDRVALTFAELQST